MISLLLYAAWLGTGLVALLSLGLQIISKLAIAAFVLALFATGNAGALGGIILAAVIAEISGWCTAKLQLAMGWLYLRCERHRSHRHERISARECAEEDRMLPLQGSRS